MSDSLTNKVKAVAGSFFATPEEFIAAIRQRIPKQSSNINLAEVDLLSLRRTNDEGFDITTVFMPVIHHRIRFISDNGMDFFVWGGRFKGTRIHSLISAPGLFVEFEANEHECVFKNEGVIVMRGGNVFGKEFELIADSGVLNVTFPSSKWDRNSVWQKPSFIEVRKAGAPFCRLILQPFVDDRRVIAEGGLNLKSLKYGELACLLSFAVIAGSKFND
jgi:hypothetical protein